jgi:inosine-uridine nucleoside N-ribohydrolase
MRRTIICTDPGIDDAMSLLYALRVPEIRVEAITTSYGNVPLEIATQNVFEILRVSGAAYLPEIAQGSHAPIQNGPFSTDLHGDDGLGGWTAAGRVPPKRMSDLPAKELIPTIARRYPREVTLILLSPATTVADALRRDPVGFQMLKEIVLMGGTLFEPGNVTAVAEFNVFLDPVATSEILDSAVPVVVVGLDVTKKVVLTPKILDGWLAGRSDPRARFLQCISARGFSWEREKSGKAEFHLHDPLAVGVALDRSLVKTRRMKVQVETSGTITRGMLVPERRQWLEGEENVEVCLEVDAERFLASFRQWAAD